MERSGETAGVSGRPAQSGEVPGVTRNEASLVHQPAQPATSVGPQEVAKIAAGQQGAQSEDEDDEDDVDFNPLFLKDDSEEEEEESEDEEEQAQAKEARSNTPPHALHALLEPEGPGSALATPLPMFDCPGGVQPSTAALGPLSPGLSLLGTYFSPGKERVSHEGGPFPHTIQGPPSEPQLGSSESLEPPDGPAKRTRAQVSLAELTLEELETFLKDDEDDFFPDIDDDEEYARFLVSISTLDDPPAEKGSSGKVQEEDEDEDDVDFVADEEAEEEEEEDAQALMGRRKVGRPRGSFKKKPPQAESRLQRVAAAARRPLAIKPSSLGGRYTQVVCHVPSRDGRPRPVLMLKPVMPTPPPPATVPRFTASQVGQLYCQVHEHVQLLLQLYSVTCFGPPLGRALADQCKAHLEALAGIREKILQDKKTAFPSRCFHPPCARPSLQLETMEDGRLKVAQWAPLVKGPVRSLLDVKPLERAGPFLQDMARVLAELNQKYPPSLGQTLPKSQLKPLFPPIPDARPINKPSQTIRSILTNQHNPSPLTREAFDSALIVQYPAVEPLYDAQRPMEGAQTFHSAFLAAAGPSLSPERPLRPLFLYKGAPADPPVEEESSQSHAVPGGNESAIHVDLLKAAKPSMVPMPLVAPMIADLVQEKFQDCFNPALLPREPQPNAKPRLFTEAEDELLALGIQQCHLDWERIQQRFLPTKTPHQIAVRVKNRCSAAAPDNTIKQARYRKTAPLTAQEKFFLDEGILHHGHDWLHLATYIPRADPRLLPKLYKEACGIKPKNWKKNQERNAWRRKQRQLAAEQAAKREAAVELRELDEEARPQQGNSNPDGKEETDRAAVPEVRGLFLAGEEEPPDSATPSVGKPANGSTRPFSATDMARLQPPAKRRKGDPTASLLPNSSLARPPLAPQSAVGRPVRLSPAARVTVVSSQPSSSVLSGVRPQAQSGSALASQNQRTVVIRPQARRATVAGAGPVEPLPPVPSLAASDGHQADASVHAPQQTAPLYPSISLPAPQRQPDMSAGFSIQGRAAPPTTAREAVSGVPLQAVQMSAPGNVKRLTVQSDRPPGMREEPNGRSIQEALGSLAQETPAMAATAGKGPLQSPAANSTGAIPAESRGAVQSATSGEKDTTKTTAVAKTKAPLQKPPLPPPAPVHTASVPVHAATIPVHTATAPVYTATVPVHTTTAPVHTAPGPVYTAPVGPGSAKPWKTRQRQPKALKAQQKAKEEEERKRKKEQKEAERQKGVKKGRGAGDVSEREGEESGLEQRKKATPGPLPGRAAKGGRGRKGAARGGSPMLQQNGGGARVWRPIVTRVIPQVGPGAVSGLDYAPGLFPSARFPGMQQAPAVQGARPSLPRGDQRGFQPVPRGSFPRPQMGSSNMQMGDSSRRPLTTAAKRAPPQGRGCEQAEARAGNGELPFMEREELPDSDDDEKWEHDDILDPEDEPHPTAQTPTGSTAPVVRPADLAEGLRSGSVEKVEAYRGPPEMERDELTDSDDEERRPVHVAGEASGRAVEMDRDELTDSEEDDGAAAQGEAMIRGFLMEQDELTESEDEEVRPGGGAQKGAGNVDAAWNHIAEPTKSHVSERAEAAGAASSDPALGVAERSVLFERDELEDSAEEDGGNNAHDRFEQDEVTELDEDG